MRLFFILFLFFSPLFAEELFTDPPQIWKTDCYRCRPLETPLRSIQDNQDNIVVDLMNPLYENGILFTDQGGVLTAPGFRVQAQSLTYTRNLENDPPVFTIQCEGNLLIDYYEWVLVGDYLYYDFITHTGFLINGRTAQPPWYVGGKEVLLLNSGDIMAVDGFLTTSEGEFPDVVLRTPQITLSPNKVLTAKNLNLWVGRIPCFWFPKIQLDLENRGRSPFAIKFGWGGFLGSHLSLLYRFLSWGEFKGIARLDAFFGHGPGGGIETRYNPKFKPIEFYTRSYYAHDISIDDPEKRDRYRFQGTFYDCIRGITAKGMYDFVSDAQMASDFYIQDFDLPTAGRTQVELRKQENSWIANLFSRVRVNDFQSVNQELPTLAFHLHPFEIPCTGVMVENTFQASYLNYVFSDDVRIMIDGEEKKPSDFHAARIFTHPHLYRPFIFGPLITTPEAGFIGIGYSNNESGEAVGQAVGELGLRVETSLSKFFHSFKHVIEPYAHYRYLTQPRLSNRNHFIFTINDGYDRLNLLRCGVENSLFIKAPCGVYRMLWFDLWFNVFFDEKKIPKPIPKGYLNVESQLYERVFIGMNTAWNFQHNLLDFWNGRIDWTLNDDCAFGIEYRHRSRYDWRKADFYNFILETARSQTALLDSPLSDRRDIFLFRTFVRLTPDLNAKFDLRTGGNRERKKGKKQRNFFEFQIELGTVLFQHWLLQFIYEKREVDNRFSFSLKLNPGPPPKGKACL